METNVRQAESSERQLLNSVPVSKKGAAHCILKPPDTTRFNKYDEEQVVGGRRQVVVVKKQMARRGGPRATVVEQGAQMDSASSAQVGRTVSAEKNGDVKSPLRKVSRAAPTEIDSEVKSPRRKGGRHKAALMGRHGKANSRA
jgi:hypothetical protein